MLKKSKITPFPNSNTSKPSPHSSPRGRGSTPIPKLEIGNDVRWVDIEGKVISCLEKLKILEGNLNELQELFTSQNLTFEELFLTKECEDALEDAILLVISKQVFEDNIKTFLCLFGKSGV